MTKAVTAPDSSMTVLMKKEDREEEFYFAPTKKKTQNKGNKVKKTDTKAIKHNVETFQLFEKLKIDAPITTDDLPATLEHLKLKWRDTTKRSKLGRSSVMS